MVRKTELENSPPIAGLTEQNNMVNAACGPPAGSFDVFDADVSWAGLSAAGVYQFNVTIPPAVPDGDAKVVVPIGLVESQGAVFIPVQR